jgi:hypothetical protein
MAVKKSGVVIISDTGLIDWSRISDTPLNQITDIKLNTTIGNCVGGLSGALAVSVSASGGERTITFGITPTNCHCNCNCQC